MTNEQPLKDFNPELALWRKAYAGHTPATKLLKETHIAPLSAQCLHSLADRGELHRVDAPAVIRRLLEMQYRGEGPQYGCMRWYWEETTIHDTNAAFFTGLPLMSMRLRFADRLDADVIAPLDQLLRAMRVWFRHAVGKRVIHYPNAYLGDLVCAWLLREIFGEDEHTPALLEAMQEAADTWRREHWGWGEHMSDIYSTVILNQLSILLLVQKHLPESTHQAYRELMGEILSIDDRFGAGPRVPAVRSYAFEACPARVPFRQRFDAADHILEHFIPRAYPGWDALAPAEVPVATDIRVPCFGGAEAVARIHPDCRLGSLSRYQFMPGVDPMEWGLCWQSFPVAFWRPAGDWGFLQFVTQQGDRLRSHPASSRTLSAHDNALSTDCQPPILGETRSEQDGDHLHVHRRFPAISPLWDRVTDRFLLLHPDPAAEIVEHPDGLDLRYPERVVSIRVKAHSGGVIRVDRGDAGSLSVNVEWSRDVLSRTSEVTSEWWIHLHPGQR